jgi:hypothetical protein
MSECKFLLRRTSHDGASLLTCCGVHQRDNCGKPCLSVFVTLNVGKGLVYSERAKNKSEDFTACTTTCVK